MPARQDEEAINLLSLDGGGVRGVASLLILHEMMVQIKESCGLENIPKPCEYFHMIGGTSTGGLIAIMLGRLRMSTEEALQEYDRCSQKIFSSRNKKWTTATEKYKATALKEVVEDLVRRRNMGEYLRDVSLNYDSKGHCFVCVMPAEKIGEPRRLRSFFTHHVDSNDEVKIWEAARATTAASVYFKPMPVKIGNRVEEFIDAAIGCNNPVIYVLQEAAAQIGNGRRLGCLISIGTGTRVVKIGRAPTGVKNVGRLLKFAKELIGTLKNTATDGEDAHRRVLGKLGDYPNAYFRFNVPDVAEKVGLDKYLEIGTLKAATATYLAEPLVAAQILNAAIGLGRNSSEHGLTLGHANGIDKDQVILTTHEAQSLGDISRFFMARDDILSKLDNHFSPRDTKGKPRREFLLHGMGGVGKTQIALKAADDFEERFKYVFHIDGTTAPSVNQSYARVCQQYCPGYSQTRDTVSGTTDEMKDVALEWVGGLSEEWLIIYDNHPDKGYLEPILPRRNTGNVIYTSRSQGFLADLPADCVYEVNSFSKEDAVELLLKIAGNEELRTNEEEMKALQASVVEVGCLPLAIEAMGSYLRKGDCTPLTYLQRFRDRQNRSELLSKPNADGSSPARPGLYTALDLSYDALMSVRRREGRGVMGTAARNALAVLNLLCFYHNENIPVHMIERSAEERQRCGSLGAYPLRQLAGDPEMDASYMLLGCKFPSEKWNDLHFNLGMQILQQFSLVKRARKGDTVSMHVMVQAWAQDKMAKETRKQLAHAARVVLIESIKPGWNSMDQPFLRLLPPHLNACMAHEAEPIGHHYQYEAHLDYKLGWYYYHQKQFPHAVDHFERALRIWKCNAGGYSPPATHGLWRLATVYHDMGRISDAEAAYMELLEMLDMRKDDMLDDYQERMDRKEEDRKRQARRQRVAHVLLSGRSNDQTVTNDDDQALGAPEVQVSAEKRDDAPPPIIKTMEQSNAVIQAANIKEPEEEGIWEWKLEVGTVHAGLASLLFDSGRPKAGRESLERAIEAARMDDEGHNFQIWTWEDELIRRSGGGDLRYWYQRYKNVKALPPDLYEKFLGHEYSFVLPIGLGEMYLGAGDLKGAYETYEPMLKRAPLLYGPSDRKTLYLMCAMAECAAHRGFFEEAEQRARKAVEVAKAAYGKWHYQTARCLNTLGAVMKHQTFDLGPESEYWNVVKEAYDVAQFAFGDEYPLTRKLKRRLEVLSSRVGEMEEGLGEDLFQDIMVRIFADGAPRSKKEYMEKASVAYREAMREKYQTREKLEKPQFRLQRGTGEGLQSIRDSGQRIQNTAIEDKKGESTEAKKRRKGKGKGKEITTLSPISEPGPDIGEEMAPRPQGRLTKGSTDDKIQLDVKKGKTACALVETSQDANGVKEEGDEGPPESLCVEKRNPLWVLEHEINLGADWNTAEKPWMRIWALPKQDGSWKRMITGAVVGKGEARWRRISGWADLDDLVKPTNKEVDDVR